MTGRVRTIVRVVASIAGVAVVGFGGFLAYIFLSPVVESHLNAVKFDSASWKARSLDDDYMWPTRLRMADDLLDSGRLSSVSRAQVEELLGPPDETSYFQDWDMVYNLGPERGFIRIDSEWLVVRLDAKGAVQEARLVRD